MTDHNEASTAEHFHALGEAERLRGHRKLAEAFYLQALALNSDFLASHIGLSGVRLPGAFYHEWLTLIYRFLAPVTAIEIGVFTGASFALIPTPALAIGVDPNPKLTQPPREGAYIFSETSDDFFARRGPEALLAGRPLNVAFIDGSHLYEQALKDFINLESYCDRRSVILIHDTLPLSEATQGRVRQTQFYSGDVWKLVLCLKHYRPNLDIFTIATPWTGLTVVTGLDPQSTVLRTAYDEAVARFIDTPYSKLENKEDALLNIAPNDWPAVEARLKAQLSSSGSPSL